MNNPFPAYQGYKPYAFVSYAHEDQTSVFVEIKWLQSQGINVWYDEGIGAGSEWSESIARAIKSCSHFIYFITPRSVTSENCRREVNFAIEEQRTILAAHIEDTELPDGLRLNLNNRQALHRRDGNSFHSNLLRALEYQQPEQTRSPGSPAKADKHTGRALYWALGSLGMLAAATLIYFFSIRTGDHMGGVQISEPRSAPEAVDIAPGARKLRQSFVPRFAVLPTERLTDDRQTQLLANLLTESIAEYFQNNVIQVASVSEHDRVLTPREIGEKHQVGYVVYLKLGHDGNQFQQSSRITETIYGTDIGARTITATGTEIHNVHEILARDVHLIETSIIEAERTRARLIEKDDQNPWEMLFAPLPDREAQILRLEKVIQKNPTFYPAIASLAKSYYWWGVISQRSKDVAADKNRALELAQRAYSIAPKDPYSIETVMVVERSFGQHELAVGYAEILLRNRVVNSGDPYLVLIAEGRSEEVLEHAKHNPRAGLEPQGRAHIELGNYAEAEAYARQALLSPGRINYIPYWMVLADALGHQGRIDEGREVFDNIPGFNFEGYLRSQLDYWGDDHTHLKFLHGIEKLGYAIPSVEVVRQEQTSTEI